MTKKRIIKVVLLVVIMILTSLFFYYVVGEEACMQKGPIRTLWLCMPLAFCIIDLSAEYIMQKDKNK